MSRITPVQVRKLLVTVSRTVPDQLTCDQCFELIPLLADAQMEGRSPDVSLESVVTHLQQCPCCAYEYESLLESLGVNSPSGR